MDLIDEVKADRAIVYDQPIDCPLEMDYSIVSERLESIRYQSQDYIKESLIDSTNMVDSPHTQQ